MRNIKYIILLILILAAASELYAVDKAKLRWIRKKPAIDSIVINGNEAISDNDIKGRMYSRTGNLLRKIKKDRRIKIQRETISRDTLEIKYLYLTNGFLSMTVSETFHMLPKDSAAMIWINISEGRKFQYGEKIISGKYEEKFDWPLKKIANKLKEGEPANPIRIRQVVFDMKTELANQGYPYSVITYDIDTTASSPDANIVFNVNSDSLVHFGQISVEGINHFPLNAGLRELKVKTGEVYSRKAILDSQKRLFESGYFTFSQLNQADSLTDRLKPDFILTVRERKQGFISVTTGAGQSTVKDLQWDFNLGMGKRDVDFTPFMIPKFNNGGHRIAAYADYSFSVGSNSRLITHRYRFRYTTPWTLGIRMPLSLTFEWEPPIRSQLNEFTIRKWGISAKTQKWFGDEIRTTTGLEYNNVKTSEFGEGVNPQDIQDSLSVRRKLFGTFRLDSRDNIFIPRTGQLTDISLDIYGGILGGEDNFYKLETAWSTYQPVWPGWIYAVRFKGGIAKAFGVSESVPIEERLYLGGANTIRGFTENTLGPFQTDISNEGDTIFTAKGANYTFIVNQEFRWKTIQVLNVLPLGLGSLFKQFPQWQSIFFDAGNGFETASEIKLDQLAFAYGTGFQIMSPAGPIRIDYARRIKTDRTDIYKVDSRWHFTILYAF